MRLARGRPRRIALWAIVAALLVGTGVVTLLRLQEAECDVERIAKPTSPLLDPELMEERPDARRDQLAAALRKMGDPFGEVLAGVHYNYQQWLHLYGVQDGLLAWTRRNAPVTFLRADDLAPRWALRPETRRVAWDASSDSFLLLSLASNQRTELFSAGLEDGREQWCTRLETRHRDGQPISTGFLADGSVLVASPAGKQMEVVRLDGDDGEERWRLHSRDVDRADAILQLDERTVVVGGREEYRLADASEKPSKGAAITAFDVEDGTTRWRHEAEDAVVHVVGASGGNLVLMERGPGGLRVLALDAQGEEVWSQEPPGGAREATLRGGAVLLEGRRRLFGVDAASGELLWNWTLPQDRTFFPYGFTLGQMPSLDERHLLMPTTSDLRVLDVRTGRHKTYAMPTDGINTTYWPYQLVATDQLIGVITNTGAIVVDRDD